MTEQELHPRMAEVVGALRDAQHEMLALLDGVSPERAERRRHDTAWSVAQVVEHLAIVEDGTGRLIGKLLRQVEGTSDPDTAPITPTLARFQVMDANVRPIAAPPMVTPGDTATLAEATARQGASRERVIAALTAASGRALGTVSHPHPVLGVLDGYQWALFLAQHQRRHFAQIRAILAAQS
jgi:hypothetical protein